ncbi:MAG: hypothetical protein AB1634_03310, partial [Thermodesulfobacteriota bacterium]
IHHLTIAGQACHPAQVAAGLEAADWPETGPDLYVFVRRLAVRGTAGEIGPRAAALTRQLVASALDGWSPVAAQSRAVRFPDRVSLVACLIRDLRLGQERWYWQRWQALFRLPRPEAMTRALGLAPLELPDILDRLAAAERRAVWQALAGGPAARVYDQVLAASGWRLPGSGEALPEPREGKLAASGEEDPAAGLGPPPDLVAAGLDLATARLVALLEAWHRTPALLGQPGAAAWLAGRCQALAGRPAAVRPSPLVARPGATAPACDTCRQAASASGAASGAARRADPGTTRMPGQEPPPASAEDRDAAPPQPPQAAMAPGSGAGLATSAGRPPPAPGSAPPARPLASSPGPGEVITGQGGLFFLLNLLKLPAAQALLAEDAGRQHAGWQWLWRLGVALGLAGDEPLQRFLSGRLHLAGPWELAGIPDLAREGELMQLGAARYGPGVWNAGLLAMPALVAASRTRLDVHYRLADARPEVRRAGLDLDCGWLPWLGMVVAFHFGPGLWRPDRTPAEPGP